MKAKVFFLLSAFIFLAFQAPPSGPIKAEPNLAPPRTPGELIALINAYRAENGLPAYTQNAILMQTAQGQADYQASTGTVTHEGPGGTRPRDRAYAAGYGGGNTIFISEIIYGSTNAGPDAAVSWWKTSQIHNDTMLASTYQEIGAGVAQDSTGRNYYTAVTGWITGVAYAPDTSSDSGNDSAGSEATAAPQVVMIPVIKAEPQPDGSVVHIIRTGQTLWTLAAVYEVPLEQILELNELPEWAVVHPGDEVLVKAPGSEPTSTPTPGEETSTPTEAPTPTRTARPTATRQSPAGGASASNAGAGSGGSGATASNSGSGSSSLTSNAEAEASNNLVRNIVVIALVSLLLIIAASFFVRPAPPEEPEDEFDPFAPID